MTRPWHSLGKETWITAFAGRVFILSILFPFSANSMRRDFAYVARDRVSRRHMCHVFRCDTPARTIANALRDICKKIMIERSLQHSTAVPGSAHHGLGGSSSTAGFGALRSADSSVATSIVGPRPNNLPTEQRRPLNKIGHILSSQFPLALC